MSSQTPIRVVLIIIYISLSACVVVPKKVASYEGKCKVAVQKIGLAVELQEIDKDLNCNNDYCDLDIPLDLAEAAFVTASSAIVSGSIAVAGNALYLLESNGECPNKDANSPGGFHSPANRNLIEKTKSEFEIEEEIVTARF